MRLGMRNRLWLRRFFTNRGTCGMNRYRIRRMAERLALKITQDLPQDRFDQELWNLAAIIEEHLFSEMRRKARHRRNSVRRLPLAVESSSSRTCSTSGSRIEQVRTESSLQSTIAKPLPASVACTGLGPCDFSTSFPRPDSDGAIGGAFEWRERPCVRVFRRGMPSRTFLPQGHATAASLQHAHNSKMPLCMSSTRAIRVQCFRRSYNRKLRMTG